MTLRREPLIERDPLAPDEAKTPALVDRVGRAGFAVGAALIVIGGLVAAVTGPLELAKGSWLAAYLVLVAGVAQCCLAAQHRVLRTADASAARLRATLAAWNGGNLLVIVGTLTATPIVVDAGGVLLLAALVAAMAATWAHRALARAVLYRVMLAALIISIPIGLTLAHVRAAG
ncbi:hypothetical protein [Agromyces sp. H66]|uniref:hypothetical protein n=1 Tax=Agromyces sp. H66 TaxID=2529859 RepID=UPI001B7D8B8E|nr:hypothetical protein [Agromyces sp. H66]